MAMVSMANSVAALLRNGADAQHWCFIAFFMLLRVKLYLDDLNYCNSTDRHSRKFSIEFSAGILSWFLWIVVAAILPTRYIGACLVLSGAILLGTLILTFSSNQPRRCSFVLFNILYIVLLLSSGFLSPSYSTVSALSMLAAIPFVLWDFKRNGSFDVFR
jgi:hypothetical protein